MTSKRCMKLLMSEGLDRNTARLLAYVGMMVWDSYKIGYEHRNEIKELHNNIKEVL